jgi:hypothetical protein
MRTETALRRELSGRNVSARGCAVERLFYYHG